MTILLLEAVKGSRARIRRLLEHHGHTVQSHEKAAEAYGAFVAAWPSVVIADVTSSGAGGLTLCRQIRASAAAVQPFIILLTKQRTALAEPPALAAEGDDFVSRPVRAADLLARLAVALNALNRRREDARELDQLRLIHKESPDPILVLGPGGEVLQANPASAPLLEAWAWAPGTPAPTLLRDLARAAAAGTRIPSRIHSFDRSWEVIASGIGDGNVCLFGHELSGTIQPASDVVDLPLELGTDKAGATGDGLSGNPLFLRLQQALRDKRIQVQYQPLISAKTDQVEGFEALVRWHEADLGWVPPDRFIPMAEARGLIIELGRQLADIAFRQLSLWRDAGHPVRISVNVSKRQLQERGFCEEMRERARVHRLTVDWITFEVTERQSLLHDATCRASLEQLGAAGFRLSLDDFGSGHSAFDMVAEIPFRELKIDMGLCRQARSTRSRPIAQAIIDMCQTLELDSVAEGIEDEKLVLLFREMGVTLLQGYYFSPPMPAEAALQYLIAGKSRRH